MGEKSLKQSLPADSPIGWTSRDSEAILNRARKFYFSTGLNDSTSCLCKSNMAYGLAKLHITQDALGMEPTASFISTPDETISRNVGRWNAGFGYGGKLSWGEGHNRFICLDVKPNYCGILAGGLAELPEPKEIIARVNEFIIQEFYIDNFRIESDFHKSNHFIDFFETKGYRGEPLPENFPPYVFLIHGSCPELRDANDKGPGLYWDKSDVLMDMAEEMDTPFGKIRYLLDSDAKRYIDYCKYADEFSKKKRKLVGNFLFGNFKLLTNPTHQGLIDYNTILLGAQDASKPEIKDQYFPIALRADLPAYLVKGKKNLRNDVIEDLGFSRRASNLGLMHRLKNANVIPHGGGYKFDDISHVVKVFTVGGRRFFVCDLENDTGMKIIEEVSALEFSYRGKTVLRRTVELDLAEPEIKLIPKYVLKI